MILCPTISKLHSALSIVKTENKTTGLVPTMGFLHEGHLSLIRMAASECDQVVVSIFVNPTQFGPEEDYEEYPRDLERDLELAVEAGASFVFVPSAKEMYPDGYSTYVEVEGELTQILCGRKRPGHFRGVTTVVAKLFTIVGPERAYFGRKDAQQLVVIRRLVKDLNMNIRIREAPIVREEDGLAKSSRNSYLDPGEREAARVLYRTLLHAAKRLREGERSVPVLEAELKEHIASEPLARLDYLEFRRWDSLAPLSTVQDNTLLALAVFIGDTRLIDNTIFNVSETGEVCSRVEHEIMRAGGK